ncbi:MAG: Holliday junction branch migration protein RuvA [Deltaproteobacteria bacterium]|jgi:Holliday junction DNA helicase RuvA|nr:Holliday junction branch migration protein RuvA [Deltaproteobacteria bacterium]
MIAYIQGVLLEVDAASCTVLSSGGVGYELFLSAHSLARLPAKGENVRFYVHTQVREDALELYAFDSLDERETFRTLIGINRVGARTAQSILGVFRPDDLRRLVLEDNALGLARVSGIGKKSAQQIFLELKYKLRPEAALIPGAASGVASSLFADAVAGLANLGYAEEEAALVVKDVLAAAPDLELGEILRAALKRMARRS